MKIYDKKNRLIYSDGFILYFVQYTIQHIRPPDGSNDDDGYDVFDLKSFS